MNHVVVSRRRRVSADGRRGSRLTNLHGEGADGGGWLGVRTVHGRAFTLTNGVVVPANLMLFGGQGLLWDPASVFYPHLRPSSSSHSDTPSPPFALFQLLAPRPEMLIFGAGQSILDIPRPTITAMKRDLNALGIQLDVLDTRNACANYNLLVEEGRSVAGLFLTLEPTDSRSAKPLH